ncbi:prophage tail fiber N-terminal domain-containing protein [Pectobacterium versatile]|uniref:phage tail fiber protein n=1 Tax=Pectobacterium versatile TaxID=2488639 RepID=UPI0011B22AE3|nr:prophage tail fiber N-terminal domain-containing protein [Pectobacterium versatile]MBA0182713.1 prophage tail fiber N-terminal domain-containing protein [Pectobacterium versatile]
MSVLISGVLMNPAGVPVSGAEVTFSALTNGPSVLNGFSASVMTDQDGNYAIPLEICEYAISIQSDGYNSVYGSVSINEKSTPATINELLKLAAMEQTVTPAIIVYFRDIQADVAAKLAAMQVLGTNAAEAASTAATARDEAAQYAQNLSAAVAQAQQASAAATTSANNASNSANGALVAKNAAEIAAENAQATLANAMLKGQFGWGGSAIVIPSSENILTYFSQPRASGIYSGLGNTGGPASPSGVFDSGKYEWILGYLDRYGTLRFTSYNQPFYSATNIWDNGTWRGWVLDWNKANLPNPVTLDTIQTITNAKIFRYGDRPLTLVATTTGGPIYLPFYDSNGTTRKGWIGKGSSNDAIQINNDTTSASITLAPDGNINLSTSGSGTVNWNGQKILMSATEQTISSVKIFTVNPSIMRAGFPGIELTNTNVATGTVGRYRLITSSTATQFQIYSRSDSSNTTGQVVTTIPTNTTGTALVTGNNAVADSSGFWKTASPVINIYSDGSFTTTDEAEGVNVERLSEGVYKITGCLGLNSDRAWGGDDGGITNPKCRNGMERIWNDYNVESDGSIIVKTYHRIHKDAPEFASNRLNLDKQPYNAERDCHAEWPDLSLIDIPRDVYLQVRVQMPEKEDYSKVTAIRHSNVYCGTVSPN